MCMKFTLRAVITGIAIIACVVLAIEFYIENVNLSY